MKHHATALALGSALCAAAPTAVLAQATPPAAPTSANTPTATATGFESGGVPAGATYAPRAVRVADGVNVTPTLGVSYGTNDNVDLSPSARARSSNVLTLTPRVVANTAYKADRYSVGYQGEIIRFQSSSRDNANNHELAATALNVLDTRLSVNSRLALLDRYDSVGTTDRTNISGTPDHWRGVNGAVLVRYGAPGARGRLEAELGAFDKRYQNNRATTADADNLSTNFAARFATRVAPKTTALVEYRHTRFDYKRDVQNLDGTEQRLLVGAEWEATALTSGSFKVGYLDKRYKAVRPGFGGLTWEGGLRWMPLTYSTVELTTGRSASDPTGNVTDYVKSAFIGARWTHQWSSYVSTRVAYTHNNSDYVGTTRADKTDTLGLEVNYDFRRWMRLGAAYEYSRRDSKDNNFDYDRNLFSLFAEVGF